jgi:DNA ligase 3
VSLFVSNSPPPPTPPSAPLSAVLTRTRLIRDFVKQGDLGVTAETFVGDMIAKSWPVHQPPVPLSLKQANVFLTVMHNTTSQEQQLELLAELFWTNGGPDRMPRLSGVEWRWMWKLLAKDLKINIGPKYVLQALSGGTTHGFDAYQRTQNLEIVVQRKRNNTLVDLVKESKASAKAAAKKDRPDLKRVVSVTCFQPVKPMLARQVSGADACAKHCPNGMVAEIKYDGERLQLHYDGSSFRFFSRNLKNVPAWKTNQVTDFVLQSLQGSDGGAVESCVLDGEILLMDTTRRTPLPFGTLNVHKKNEFQDAVVCVFWFDILFLNGRSLLDTPLKERRRLLQHHIKVVPNRMELSEQHWLGFENPEDTTHHTRATVNEKPKMTLANTQFNTLMARAMAEGLEGLVIKDASSVYAPGARHWNKIKKDYIDGMADSADLLVLGAYYGSGTKGGLASIFLVGTHDPRVCTAGNQQGDISRHSRCFKTVTRVGNGFDDATIATLQRNLREGFAEQGGISWVPTDKVFERIADLAPWLNIDKMLTPDFVVQNPLDSPVWEVAGAEFSKTLKHTADGISIRFPRVTAVRDDKSWGDATNLDELKRIVKGMFFFFWGGFVCWLLLLGVTILL